MMTTAIQNEHDNATEPGLFMAFELSENTWKLGFSIGHGQKPRERPMAARDLKRLLDEVAHAKSRFGCGTARAFRWGQNTVVGSMICSLLPSERLSLNNLTKP